jgi:hypothetical protein
MIDQFALWKTYEFRMMIDGDYLDIYVGDIKLITLIAVEQVFLDEFKSLIKTNTCDLTNVIWPCRAEDGSMYYPPPQLAQAAPEQPETVTVDTPVAEYEDAAAVIPIAGTLVQEPGIGLSLIIVLIVWGIAIAVGVAVFLVRRKRHR